MAKKTIQTPYAFLDSQHPIYTANRRRWEINEARLAGGDNVIDELRPFDWEVDRGPGSPYQQRQEQAIYLNFPDIFATAITGHLLRFAPKPGQGLNFGNLGNVNTPVDWKKPSQADQLWNSIDRPSQVGMTWNQWWMDEFKLAMATGHRWHYAETPAEDAVTKQREQFIRPYMISLSPLQVPNWEFDEYDRLNWAVLRIPDYSRRWLNSETQAGLPPLVSGSVPMRYTFLVREGESRFGEEFVGGGWWKFTPNKEPYDNGTWDDTDGEIPVYALFYERAKGTVKIPAMSRSGTTELGQAGIAMLNTGSAANFQAWDGGTGIEWLAGVDEDGMELATTQLGRGDRYIALQPNQDTEATPQVYHSGAGGPAAEMFTSREKSIVFMAAQLGIVELMGQTKSTGTGQSADFTITQVPRIVRAASNLQNAQRQALYWLSKRFGVDPQTNVDWPEKFDLMELVERIQAFFTVERLSGIRSATVDAQAMVAYADEKDLIQDDTQREVILKEYEESAKQRDAMVAAQAAQLDNLNQPGSIGGPVKTGASAATDKARSAGKKADRTTTKQTRPKGTAPKSPGF